MVQCAALTTGRTSKRVRAGVRKNLVLSAKLYLVGVPYTTQLTILTPLESHARLIERRGAFPVSPSISKMDAAMATAMDSWTSVRSKSIFMPLVSISPFSLHGTFWPSAQASGLSEALKRWPEPRSETERPETPPRPETETADVAEQTWTRHLGGKMREGSEPLGSWRGCWNWIGVHMGDMGATCISWTLESQKS